MFLPKIGRCLGNDNSQQIHYNEMNCPFLTKNNFEIPLHTPAKEKQSEHIEGEMPVILMHKTGRKESPELLSFMDLIRVKHPFFECMCISESDDGYKYRHENDYYGYGNTHQNWK